MPYRENPDGTVRRVTWEEFSRIGCLDNRWCIRTYNPNNPGEHISTVFLAIDHGMGGQPVLYETMVFGGDENGGHDERHHTRREAEEYHQRLANELGWSTPEGPLLFPTGPHSATTSENVSNHTAPPPRIRLLIENE